MTVPLCSKTFPSEAPSPTETWIELSPIQAKSKKIFETIVTPKASIHPELQDWTAKILNQLEKNDCFSSSDTSKAGAIVEKAQFLYDTLKKPKSPSWAEVRTQLSHAIRNQKK